MSRRFNCQIPLNFRFYIGRISNVLASLGKVSKSSGVAENDVKFKTYSTTLVNRNLPNLNEQWYGNKTHTAFNSDIKWSGRLISHFLFIAPNDTTGCISTGIVVIRNFSSQSDGKSVQLGLGESPEDSSRIQEQAGAERIESCQDATTEKPSQRHDMAILFTCTVCDTRSAKTMSKSSYETGIVIVRCPSCRNLHLIADRLGWFGEPGSVENFLSEQGVEVRRGSDETYEFGLEDLQGWTKK